MTIKTAQTYIKKNKTYEQHNIFKKNLVLIPMCFLISIKFLKKDNYYIQYGREHYNKQQFPC